MALKKSQKSLKGWTNQRWRTASGKPSTQGPNATGEVYAPSKTISTLKKTKKGKKKLAAANAKKRKATKSGKQYARHGLHEGRKV